MYSRPSRYPSLWIFLVFVLLLLASAAVAGYYFFWPGHAGAESEIAGQTEPVVVQPTFTPTASDGDAVAGVAADQPVNGAGQSPRQDAQQNTQTSAQPAQGGQFVRAVPADADVFNPVLTTDPTGQAIVELLFPRLLGQDPHSGFIVPTELAQRWEISPDGRVYTFYLRNNVYWTDGTPVSAADFKFTYDALASEVVNSPFRDRATLIERIDVADAQTVVVTLAAANCTALHNLRRPLLPSHRFAADFSDVRNSPLNQTPTVSAGPFHFEERIPGQQILLARNAEYWKGPPRVERYVLRVIPDAGEQWRQLGAGDVDLMALSTAQLADLPEIPSGVTLHTNPAPAYSFMAVNLADPQNPQPGYGEDGRLVQQAPHPILGDVEVRRALASAIDYQALIDTVYGGYGSRLASYVLPTIRWAVASDLAPVAFDADAARARLDAAGWRDEDGDGVRTREDETLSLTLLANVENALRVQLGREIKSQLEAAGFAIDYQTPTYDEVTTSLLTQQYDLVLIAWDNLIADPGTNLFWFSREDAPPNGYNFTSFHDETINAWLDTALHAPGCPLDARGELYHQVQRRVAEAVPYIFLVAEMEGWAYDGRWQGISPGAWQFDYNVNQWWLAGQE